MKVRIKFENIFVVLSILFIFGCCIYYGSRLVNVAIQCAKEHGCTKIVGVLDESVLNNGRERILDFCQKQNFNIIEKDNTIELEYWLS